MPWSSVSNVNLKHVIVGWEISRRSNLAHFYSLRVSPFSNDILKQFNFLALPIDTNAFHFHISLGKIIKYWNVVTLFSPFSIIKNRVKKRVPLF